MTGNGRADKAQVTAMVTRILALDTPPRPADAADALALAICQVWRGTAQNRLRLASQKLAAERLLQQTLTARRRSELASAARNTGGNGDHGDRR